MMSRDDLVLSIEANLDELLNESDPHTLKGFSVAGTDYSSMKRLFTTTISNLYFSILNNEKLSADEQSVMIITGIVHLAMENFVLNYDITLCSDEQD